MLSIYRLSEIQMELCVLHLHLLKSGSPTKEEIHVENISD